MHDHAILIVDDEESLRLTFEMFLRREGYEQVKVAATLGEALELIKRDNPFPVAIGRGGMTRDKREGDGATPAGVHRITGCLYRPDRMAKPCDWAVPIGPGDLWSDDPGDEAYNLMVRAPYGASAERLWRGDRLYDLVLLTDWNWPRALFPRLAQPTR